jgi:hypothetical protein
MKGGLILLMIILLIPIVLAGDVLVWKGQYYTGTTFNTGTYEFNFTVYDNLTGGNICYSNTTNLTTGNWGEWETEQYNVSLSCNNISKDYFLNININRIDQTPRRRLAVWSFLRKDVDEITAGKLQTVSQVIAPIIQADMQIVAPIVNGTQIVASHVTANNITTNYGFFSYLGSLINRIVKLFVQDIDISGNLTGITKEVFFPIDSTDANLGDFRTKSVSSGGILRSDFQVPSDFSTLVSLEVILIPAGTNAAAPVDLYSDYGAIGEAYTQNSESLSTTWNLGTASNFYAMNISGVFASLEAGDFCSIMIDEGNFGFVTHYLGVRLKYKT